MLCDNCHERPASIHLYTNVNGQDREISLCQQCYQELKNQQGQNNSMNNNNAFFGDFDDLFNALNNNNNEQNNPQGRGSTNANGWWTSRW
jgi:ATP-dependent Clp protease ATP-binding subunit ClpE